MKRRIMTVFVCMLLVSAFTLNTFGHPNRKSEWQGFTSTSQYSPNDSYKSARTRAIQSVLKYSVNSYLYSHVTVDGSFGSGTKGKVEYYQGLYSLTVDGSVGPNTWGSLYDRLTHGSYVANHYWYYRSSQIGSGSENDQIEYIRRGDPSGTWQVKNTNTGTWITFEYAS